MRGGFKLIVVLGLIASFYRVDGFLLAADFADEIQELNSEIEARKSNIDQLNRQIDLYEAKIASTQQKEVSLRNELDLLTNRIAKTELDITSTEAEVDLVNVELSVVEVELRSLEKDLETQRALIKNVLYEIQIEDTDLALQLVFGKDSFSDLFDDLERLETISAELENTVEASKNVRVAMLERKERQEEKDNITQPTPALLSAFPDRKNRE